MQSTLFATVHQQQFIPTNYLQLPKTELFPADVLNKKCSFSLWPKGSLNYITTMHYLRPKSLAPEEILFLKLGNLARFSLSSCSLLTVIKRCMSPLVCVHVTVRGREKTSVAVVQFPLCACGGSVKVHVEGCDGRDAHGRIKQARGKQRRWMQQQGRNDVLIKVRRRKDGEKNNGCVVKGSRCMTG